MKRTITEVNEEIDQAIKKQKTETDTIDEENDKVFGPEWCGPEVWRPVVVKHFGEEFAKAVLNKYEVSNYSQIRNKKTGKVLSNQNERVDLYGNEIKHTLRRHNVAYYSFNPSEAPSTKEDYDEYNIYRKNGDTSDNRLCNLKRLTPAEGNQQTSKRNKGKRKSLVKKRGTKTRISFVKEGGDVKLKGKTFDSLTCIADFFGIYKGNACRNIKNGYFVAKFYKFEKVEEPLLPDEIFKQIGEYFVSNRGRVKNKNGKIEKGVKQGKYRTHKLKLPGDTKYKNHFFHDIAFRVFIGEIPEGMQVMHDDTRDTLDEEGCERNYVEDFKLGTQTENSQSYHDNRTDLKKVKCIETDVIYNSAGHAGRMTDIDHSSIGKVCKGKQHTAGGYTWKYV